MLTEIYYLTLGVIAILLLAEIAVRNSIRLAKHFGWSGTFIGLTILSIGTSVPEIMSAVIGSLNIVRTPVAMNTISGLIVGQNVGSDIFQQSFVLPLVALVGTIVVVRKNLISQAGALIIGTILMWFMTIGGMINRIEGFIMLVAYVGYLFYLHKKQTKKEKKIELKTQRVVKGDGLSKLRIAIEIAAIIIAFTVMAYAANKVLEASTSLVSTFPISASYFGVILLGIASALPELTTALIAVLKHKKGISAGVLIGSNVTNPLLGIGLGALISGYAIPKVTMFYDLPCKIGIASLIFYFLWKDERLNRYEACVLIGIFAAYLLARNWLFPVDF